MEKGCLRIVGLGFVQKQKLFSLGSAKGVLLGQGSLPRSPKYPGIIHGREGSLALIRVSKGPGSKRN